MEINMKLFITILLMLVSVTLFAQWTPSGNNIYNSNSGNVGIGTNSPVNILDVNGIARFRRQGSTTAGATLGGDALTLQGWGANNPYIEWRNSTGVRQGYMGWNTNRLSLALENSYNFTIENGNVGIGTSTPAFLLDVSGTLRSYGYLRTTGVGDGYGYYADDGVGSTIFSITRQPNNETRFQSYGFHTFYSGNSTGSEKMRIDGNGKIGIGTQAPSGKLHINTDDWMSSLLTFSDTHYSPAQVYNFQIESDGLKIKQDNSINYLFKSGGDFVVNNGAIRCKEVRVSLTPGAGPDYVFNSDYNLLTLEEIKTYIDKNKHLPEVPSAKEMEANGVQLGEMNMLLLKKIEELTLYTIDMNKKLQELTIESEEQRKEIIQLKAKESNPSKK
jgi:hypothetical protein